MVIWVSLLYVGFIEGQNREREKREGLLIVNVKRKFQHSNAPSPLYYYENYKTCPSFIQVSLGVSRTFPGVSHLLTFPLEKMLIIGPDTSDEDIWVRVFNFDPTVAPEGKTVIITGTATYNYKYWVDLRENNRKKYKEEKKRIADELIEILEKKFGNIKSHVEVSDIATPATVIRYTNNWKGSTLGWLPTHEVDLKPMKNELPGAIVSGRNITQVICKKDKKKFTTGKY